MLTCVSIDRLSFYLFYAFVFFFSSRRRHTRWTGDWSSDVCSSDLVPPRYPTSRRGATRRRGREPRDPHAGGMSIALYRLDDRLIHGQVVVGWGKPLNVGFIVLVDDAVRSSEWEQELYRMGVPADIEVVFASTVEAAQHLTEWESDPRVGILV